MTPIVEVKSLTKQFHFGNGRGALTAVDDVSFTVSKGTCLGIVGESGSGKSTVARLLVGLDRPTSGRIIVCDEDRAASSSVTRHARRRRARQIQMVFQDPFGSLDPRQSGIQCLDEVLRIHFDLSRADRQQRIATLGDQVGLTNTQLASKPSQLSGGQCQRLSIARALAAEPEVLVLDESVSALDVSVQAHVLNQLADIRDETGTSYVFISHDLSVINQIADTVLVMRHGKVVETGTTSQILSAPQEEYTRRLRDSVPKRGWTFLGASAGAPITP